MHRVAAVMMDHVISLPLGEIIATANESGS